MMSENKRNGVLFVISAPSGAGKSTLIKALMKKIPELEFSVSHTTRLPRAGEINGREYFFVERAEFSRMMEKGRLAEWAEVHGNYYGTSVDFLESCLSAGKSIILDIDVQGKKLIEKAFPGCVSIFILPPSTEILRQRLSGRGTDSPETVEKRMKNAESEIAESKFFKHLVVNDSLDIATEKFITIVAEYLK